MPTRKTTPSAARQSSTAKDAIAQLKADHQEVSRWFKQFAKSKSDAKKMDLATKICAALRIHTQIEEEIFYPPFYNATGDKDLHHEAIIEHNAAKTLIAEIEASSPEDDYFEAKVNVLSEMIEHHVKEEEQPGGMFAKARQAEMDLKELGERLMARKQKLLNESAAPQQRAAEARVQIETHTQH